MGYKKFHGTPTEFLKEAALCERRNTASFPHTVAGQLWILTSIPHSFPFMIYMHDTLYDSHTVKKYFWEFYKFIKKHHTDAKMTSVWCFSRKKREEKKE